MTKPVHRKIEQTPQHQREIEAIRERFRRERPSLKRLRELGDVDEVVTQGEYVDLLAMLAALRKHRQSQGLTLADVSQRCRIERAALSRLENGVFLTSTFDKLHRYAAAIGVEIAFSVRASMSDHEADS